MPPRRPNQTRIAKKLGISQRAVSKALRGEKDISEKTRQRVLALAEEIGYRPNRLAASIFSGKTRMLGALLPSLRGMFFSTLLHGMERTAFDAEYVLVPMQTHDFTQTDDYDINLLLQNRVDGLIVSPRVVEWESSIYATLFAQGERIVFVNQKVTLPEACCVYSDDIAGAEAIVQHLIERGHRRIAYVGASHPTEWTNYSRRRGYVEALRRAGIEPRPEWFAFGGEGEGERDVSALLRESPEITAVFAMNDQEALRVIETAARLGRRVPEELSVAGYGDDLPYIEHMRLPLTTVAQEPEALGRRAVELLLRQLRGERVAGDHALPTRLVVRDSVAPPQADAPLVARLQGAH